MNFPKLYAIVDTAALNRSGRCAAPDAAKAFVTAGVRLLQYRHKGHFTHREWADMERIAQLCVSAGVQFVVNDRADYAKILQAGLHLGQEDLPPAAARIVTGDELMIGLSTHNEEQLMAGDKLQVDYLAIGPIFSTTSKEKPDPIVGIEKLKHLRTLTTKPLVAIGGITKENAPEVLEAGADSVAIILGLLPEDGSAAGIEARAREWLRATGL